jgi:sphingomyelin phosphodiesterase
VVGLEAECGEPLCCRAPNPAATRRAAGPFGDFNCDAPRQLLEDLYTYAARSTGLFPIDYVLWTGDIPPHDVWESSRSGYTALMEDQAQMLAATFPNARVLPAIGNHESVPVDQFAPRSVPGTKAPMCIHLLARTDTYTDTHWDQRAHVPVGYSLMEPGPRSCRVCLWDIVVCD